MYVKYIFSRIKPKKNPKSPAQTTALKFKKKRYSKGYVKTLKKGRVSPLWANRRSLTLHYASEKYELS